MSIFDDKQIDLDLNGPILSFTTNPTGVGSTGVLAGGTGGGTVSLTGIATATFPTSANNAGYVTYRWYEQGVGSLSEGTYITGTATTTLTLSNLITPDDSGRKFYVEADYVPPYTGTTATYTTGNANNEPLNSGIGTVTVDPLISIVSQPSAVSVLSGQDAVFIIDAELSNTEDDLTYQWQLDGADVSNGTVTKSSVVTTVSGATSSTLTLNSDGSGITYTISCVVSSATGSNSPLTSNEVTYTPQNVAGFSIVSLEKIVPNTSIASTTDLDLNNGEYTFNTHPLSSNDPIQFYSFYAKEKDLDVEMDLYGGKGADYAPLPTDVNQYASASGGEGGFSRIRFTMKKDEEYVIAGLIDSINAPFVYRKGALLAVVGQGGDAGAASNGGAGGGVQVSGDTAVGPHGNGGDGGGVYSGHDQYLPGVIAPGSLGSNGIFGTALGKPPLIYPGDTWAGDNAAGAQSGIPGRTIRCTKGVYWAQQGIPPCTAMSPEMKFRLSDGTEVTNTADIVRGFKAGYNIMQTAGNRRTGGPAFTGASTSGKGGNGAQGGQGGFGAGGGGGSGYHDGSVTVVSTQAGGNTGKAKVILRIQS